MKNSYHTMTPLVGTLRVDREHYHAVYAARKDAKLSTNHKIHYKHAWVGGTFQHPRKSKLMTIESVHKCWYWGWYWVVIAVDEGGSHGLYAYNINSSSEIDWNEELFQELNKKYGDIEEASYYEGQKEAIRRFKAGESPCWTHNIADQLTCGYGELSDLGVWEFELPLSLGEGRTWQMY